MLQWCNWSLNKKMKNFKIGHNDIEHIQMGRSKGQRSLLIILFSHDI